MNHQSSTINHNSLTLGWLYPELMSTYGDRGNITVLKKIAEDNGIKFDVLRINQTSNSSLLSTCDILFMGGAQDLQQEIVNRDLIENKGEILREKIEQDTPGLYICGAYQFLGNYYKDAYGTTIPGLGIFEMHTESYKTKPRLIGNIVVKPSNSLIMNHKSLIDSFFFVGFENHGGRTYLADKNQAFAKVIQGYGNNGKDKTEGIHYKNSIGTYLHGPILPSNPELAVYLLKTAYLKKYGKESKITFDNELAKKAKQQMLRKLKTDY
ncbi:MAG: cobalamin biosynthesis protein CobQ [Candidatus Levybacteria bacterium]|nr:cobalamin biosynthesis protein CobQ [Candidatus Levybacteria bacterium]